MPMRITSTIILRTLDRAGCVRILVQELPEDERWAAILDRLQRASGDGARIRSN